MIIRPQLVYSPTNRGMQGDIRCSHVKRTFKTCIACMHAHNPLSHDCHLLELEDVVDKELLYFLTAEVDAKLLKVVDLKHLKAKNVQHSD